MALVGRGKFVGLLPASILHFNATRLALKILPVRIPVRLFSVDIATVRNRALSPLAERCIDWTRQIAKSLVATPDHQTRKDA